MIKFLYKNHLFGTDVWVYEINGVMFKFDFEVDITSFEVPCEQIIVVTKVGA